jgi:hypothetical protein
MTDLATIYGLDKELNLLKIELGLTPPWTDRYYEIIKRIDELQQP